MGRLKNFIGSIFIGSGMKPKGEYPLMEAYDIVVDEDGTRLDEKLASLSQGNIEVDDTLTESGKAADAKAVRDLVNSVVGDIHTRLKNI